MASYNIPGRNVPCSIEPVYGKAWVHPGNGEVRYYINNVGDIADSRKGKAWVDAAGELHFQNMYEGGQVKIRAAVAANPRVPSSNNLHAALDRDFVGAMSRMMDEGWQ